MTAKPGSRKKSGSTDSGDAGNKDRLVAELKDRVAFLENELRLKPKDATSPDVVERNQADDARSRLAAIVSSCDDAIIGKMLNGTITSWNECAERIYGYSEAEAVGKPIGIIIPQDHKQELEEVLDTIRCGGRVEHHETVRVTKDGRRIDVSVTISPILDASGNVIGASTIARDITQRKRDEKERNIIVEFLSLVNEARSTRELVEKTVTFFQQKSDCEAVGIRLPEGDDYPYYEARGFSPEFIRKENRLCTRDEQGCVLRDKDGFPMLECMCGNIITGRFDPSRPFFTARGSFWTNSSTELLATVTEKDLLVKTRNVCIYEGYESMALIALRVGAERLGALQLNDRRKGRFTPEQIAMWERLANYLAVALAKFRAEDVLRSSESKLHALLENAGAAIFIADTATGEILDCNAKAESLIGRPRREIIGQHQIILHPPDLAEAHSEMFARHAIANMTTDYEAVVQHRDGRVIPVMINAATVTINGREVMIGFFLDITERKLAEEALKLTQFSLDNFGDSAIWLTLDGRIVYVNHEACRSLGYSKEELLSMHIWDIDPDYTLERLREFLPEKRQGRYTKFESKHVARDGRVFPVEVTSCYTKYGDKEYLITFDRDITERKRAEKAVRKSEAHLAKSQEIAHLGSFEWDLVHGEDEWSDEMYRILGLKPGEVKPSLEVYLRLIHPEDLEVVKKHAENVSKNHKYPGGYEVRIIRPDGKTRWIRLDGEFVLDGTGKPVRLLGMILDITESKRAEEALKAAKMQADLYVDLMCHDISNMNQVGLGFLEMALDLLDLDEMGREMLLKPKSAFENSSKLIDNVRKLQKARSGEYQDKEMDIGQVLRKVQDYYSKQYGRGTTINYLMNAGYVIRANELLYDLFSNLVENAIKHSRGHPVIDINVEPASENGRGYYKVAIVDQGPGIPDNLKAVIFDRKLTGDIKSKGSGIGLFMVKTLTDSYNGRVWVEDRVKGDYTKGARFVIMLPAVDK